MSRSLVASLLERSRFGVVARHWKAWSGVLALAYHRIGDGSASPFDRGLWSASPAALDAQIQFLKRHFDIIGPANLVDLVRRARGRYILISFDDGYRDNYEHAFPILRSHGVGAMFFITTGFIDRPRCPWWDEIAWMVRRSRRGGVPGGPWLPSLVPFDEPGRDRAVRTLLRRYKSLAGKDTEAYLDFLAEATESGRYASADMRETWMTWDMVREMRAGGMWIGGHTVNHPVLARLTRSEQEREIAGCGKRIAEELGEPMRCFSYPVGGQTSFTNDTRTCLTEQGVEFAFSYYGGYRQFNDWDPYDIRRYRMETDVNLDLVCACATFPQVFA
jgi:peptidoglycan/xylan/chitin deacetylase (PgdA/CDA1 family)